jgi:two-component system, cell cycle response regulator
VLAERLRKAVEGAEFADKGTRIPVTISVGVAAQEKNAHVDIDQLLARADARLYIAKRRGRNRLCATDGGEALEDMPADENTGPKIDDALTMIQHGNVQAMLPHLPGLLEKVLTLFNVANERLGGDFDTSTLQQKISALRAAQDPGAAE